MRYWSDTLNEMFDSEEALLNAETAAEKAAQEKRLAREKKAAEQKERSAEVDGAYKMMVAAKKHYDKVIEAYCKDYGAYHHSVSEDELKKGLEHFLSLDSPGIAELARTLCLL